MDRLLTSKSRHHIERNVVVYVVILGGCIGITASLPIAQLIWLQIPLLAIEAIALGTIINVLIRHIHDARVERDVAIARETQLRVAWINGEPYPYER